MRLMIATDAWHPQVNGVVRTLERLTEELRAMGNVVEFLTPRGYPSIPCPGYSEIRLAFVGPGEVRRRIEAFGATDIHIATEGPIGWATRKAAESRGRCFTTSFHTRFPEYLSARVPVPERWTWAWLRRFHAMGRSCMVATESLRTELGSRGFPWLDIWSRGVDVELFRPRDRSVLDLPRPIFLNVGRVAVEKNLPAFLDLDLPGTKVVVGDGPALAGLRRDYPDVVFTGVKTGEELAAIYASADAFVFPSLTDTFGNVLVESLASGVPVAAFPVTGPLDVVGSSRAGVLDRDLRAAALAALDISRDAARAHALNFSWRASAEQFVYNTQLAQVRYLA